MATSATITSLLNLTLHTGLYIAEWYCRNEANCHKHARELKLDCWRISCTGKESLLDPKFTEEPLFVHRKIVVRVSCRVTVGESTGHLALQRTGEVSLNPTGESLFKQTETTFNKVHQRFSVWQCWSAYQFSCEVCALVRRGWPCSLTWYHVPLRANRQREPSTKQVTHNSIITFDNLVKRFQSTYT